MLCNTFLVEAQLIEQFSWDLKVGIIKFGDATMIRTRDQSTGNQHIKAEAQGSGIFKLLYNNSYTFSAEVDPETGLPIHSSYSMMHGDMQFENFITYDHTTLPDSTVIISQVSGEKHIHKESFEMLTALQFFRDSLIHPNLEKGSRFTIKTYYTDSPFDLIFVFKGKEKIRTLFGTKNCYVFKPIPILGNFFHSEDDITLWFTADDLKLLVKMRAELNFIGITANLISYQNPLVINP